MNYRQLLLTTAFVLLGSTVLVDVIGLRTNRAKALAAEASRVVNTNTSAKREPRFSAHVDKDGIISLPKNYQQKWTHLGSWAAAKKPGGTVHEMHNVYTQPETIAAFNETGEFPDGTVLVKEVRETEVDGLTTGHAAWSTNMKHWFVMIKDRKERFEESDHWGDGWGWALFEAKNPSKNVSAGYDTSCLGCHVPAQDSDWVYVYGYPELTRHKKE